MSGNEDYLKVVFFSCEMACLGGDNSRLSCLENILNSPPTSLSHLGIEERKKIVNALYDSQNISLYGGHLEEGLNDTHFISGNELPERAKEDIKKLYELCNICCEQLKTYPLKNLIPEKAQEIIRSCITSNYSNLAPERVGYLSGYILKIFLLD